MPILFFLYLSFAQESIPLDKLKQQSLNHLKNYSIEKLSGHDPIKDKSQLAWVVRQSKSNPKDFLFLPQLKTLSVAQAKELKKFRGYYIYLNNLSHLEKKAATKLSQWKGTFLSLDGLTKLDEETARQLAQTEIITFF